jgi:6-pyruvoyltetrahydropterin/6-carboxytetrahydropterin synthase
MSLPNNAPQPTLVRTTTFSSAHRYFNPSLSIAENRALYGSLYREHGFGHNFLLEAHLTGAVDAITGMVLDIALVDRYLTEVSKQLDHLHLNELEIFSSLAPTPERIAAFYFHELSRRLKGHPGVELKKVRLFEGDSLWIDSWG